MLAYRRDNVEALNRPPARAVGDEPGCSPVRSCRPGGRRYRAGDRIITLAPGPGGAWVTSQPAAVSPPSTPTRRQLTAVTPDGQQLRMGPDEIGAERLGTRLRHHRPSQRKARPSTSPTSSTTAAGENSPTWP